MIVTYVSLKNWRNFQNVSFRLRDKMYLIGPNASGKSNLLDVFRFLRDVANPSGGGLKKAVADRGGMKKLRCLSARKDPVISIEIHLTDSADNGNDDNDNEAPDWKYRLGFKSEGKGRQRVMVAVEQVHRAGVLIVNRPTDKDTKDPDRLTQTSLQQINANSEFRALAQFFEELTYLHLVPQLLKHSDQIGGNIIENDPFGQGFLERVSKTPERTRLSRLRRIETVLRSAVPQLKELNFERDPVTGRPHLRSRNEHWRPKAGWQREDQFSDGTLRLLALLWSLLDGDSLLLLEEPELSLHDAIVEKIPALINAVQRKSKKRRQIIISTHSNVLLADIGIDARCVLVLKPSSEGTTIVELTDEDRIQLKAGLSVAEVLLPKTRMANQLTLF